MKKFIIISLLLLAPLLVRSQKITTLYVQQEPALMENIICWDSYETEKVLYFIVECSVNNLFWEILGRVHPMMEEQGGVFSFRHRSNFDEIDYVIYYRVITVSSETGEHITTKPVCAYPHN